MAEDKSKETVEKKPPPPGAQLIEWQRALLWHALGFATIVLVLWSDQFFNLAYNWFGRETQGVDYTDAAIKSVIVVFLWMFSAYKIFQILSRLSYLESFMHICAWCRKIEKDNQWLTLEQHLTHETGKKASHGICPECAKKLEKEYSEPA